MAAERPQAGSIKPAAAHDGAIAGAGPAQRPTPARPSRAPPAGCRPARNGERSPAPIRPSAGGPLPRISLPASAPLGCASSGRSAGGSRLRPRSATRAAGAPCGLVLAELERPVGRHRHGAAHRRSGLRQERPRRGNPDLGRPRRRRAAAQAWPRAWCRRSLRAQRGRRSRPAPASRRCRRSRAAWRCAPKHRSGGSA